MAILMNVPDLTFMILLFPPFGLGITLAPVLYQYSWKYYICSFF